MISTTVHKPATTPIPIQLSETEFPTFIVPHLSRPKRGEVHTGLLPSLQPHPVGALYGEAVEVPPYPERRRWQTGHPLHQCLPRLCEMGG
jgi:hypothetical protein